MLSAYRPAGPRGAASRGPSAATGDEEPDQQSDDDDEATASRIHGRGEASEAFSVGALVAVTVTVGSASASPTGSWWG